MFTEFSVGFWLYMAGFVGLTLYTLIGFICELVRAKKKTTTSERSTRRKRVQPSLR